MTTPRPQITLMVHRDGEVGSRTFRMPIWLFRVLVVVGTVLLMAALVVDELSIKKGVASYEHVAGHGHHDHLICMKCGRIDELNVDFHPKSAKEELKEELEDLAQRQGGEQGEDK